MAPQDGLPLWDWDIKLPACEPFMYAPVAEGTEFITNETIFYLPCR